VTTFPLTRRTAIPRQTLIGLAAVAAVVALWASFALSARAVEGAGLTMADAAIVRFAVPALVLAPWIPRTVRALRGERSVVVILILSAGLPHYLLFAWGAHLTSAALTGLLVPGTVPLFVAILLFARHRRRLPRRRLVALFAIATGVLASAMFTAGPAGPGGIAVLLAAGFVWAAYTVGLSRSRLDPVGVIVLVSLTSTACAVVLAVTGVLPSHLFAGSIDVAALGGYALVQGVGTGLLSTACYVVAVKNLGSSIPAAAGALSPVLTAVVAVPLFGEPITAGLAVALALIVSGVAMSALTPAAAVAPAAAASVSRRAPN
jgi:drug/metabolite transporter (DMT)-like permease